MHVDQATKSQQGKRPSGVVLDQSSATKSSAEAKVENAALYLEGGPSAYNWGVDRR